MNLKKLEIDLNKNINYIDKKKKNNLKILIPLKQFLYFDINNQEELKELDKSNLNNIFQSYFQIPVINARILFNNLKKELLYKLNNKLQTSTFLTSLQAKNEIINELKTHRIYLEKIYEVLVSLKYNYINLIDDNEYIIADEIAYLYNEAKKFIVTKGNLMKLGIINYGILSSCEYEDGIQEYYKKNFLNNKLVPGLKNGIITYYERNKDKKIYELQYINSNELNEIKYNYTIKNIELTIKECFINDLIKQTNNNLYLYFSLINKFIIKNSKIFYNEFTNIVIGLEFGINFYKWIVLNINEFSCKKYLNNIFQIIDFDKNLRNEWILNILYSKFIIKKYKFIQILGNKKDFVIKILDKFSYIFNSEKINEFLDSNLFKKLINNKNIQLNRNFLEDLFLINDSLINDSLINNYEESNIQYLIKNIKDNIKTKYLIIYFLELDISIKCNTNFSINSGFKFNLKYEKNKYFDFNNYEEFKKYRKNILQINQLYLEVEEYINKENIFSSLTELEVKKLKLYSNLIKNSEINSNISNSKEKNIFLTTERTYLIIEKNNLKIGSYDSKFNRLKSLINLEIIDNEKIFNKNNCEINFNGRNFVKRENYKNLIPYFLILPLFIKNDLINIFINKEFIKLIYKKFIITIILLKGYEFLTFDYLKTYELRISAHDSFGFLFYSHDFFEGKIIKNIKKYLKFLEFLVDLIVLNSNNEITKLKIYEIFKSEDICSITLLRLKKQIKETIIYKESFNLEEFKTEFIKTNLKKDLINLPEFIKCISLFFKNNLSIKTIFNFINEKQFFSIKILNIWFFISPNMIKSNNLIINKLIKNEDLNIIKYLKEDNNKKQEKSLKKLKLKFIKLLQEINPNKYNINFLFNIINDNTFIIKSNNNNNEKVLSLFMELNFGVDFLFCLDLFN